MKVWHPSYTLHALTAQLPFPILETNETKFSAQAFFVYDYHTQTGRHLSSTPSPPQDLNTGPIAEGYTYRNTLASYVHLHFSSNPAFPHALLEKARQIDPAALHLPHPSRMSHSLSRPSQDAASILHSTSRGMISSQPFSASHHELRRQLQLSRSFSDLAELQAESFPSVDSSDLNPNGHSQSSQAVRQSRLKPASPSENSNNSNSSSE